MLLCVMLKTKKKHFAFQVHEYYFVDCICFQICICKSLEITRFTLVHNTVLCCFCLKRPSLFHFTLSFSLSLSLPPSPSLSLSLSLSNPLSLSFSPSLSPSLSLSLLSLPPSLYLSFYLSFSLFPSLSLLFIILFGVSNGRFRPCLIQVYALVFL